MKQLIFILLIVVLFTACSEHPQHTTKTATDSNGYTYEYVTNDPIEARIYTLDNGLKVYLTDNKDEPRIQTMIAVKAGSTYDPAETTGLAHYLEHMMFKGTDEIGSLDWEKEKALLDKISDLYEQHRNTTDPEQKDLIYHRIDSISGLAAEYVAANEYDKLISGLGAKGTNAFTSHERTVYINNIPTNELEKWLMLESERFSQLVLRLFHTELEAVYEEFNMGQDNDYRKAYHALMEGVFEKHPYGTQTTIGEAEHLKNPSMINIHNYWNTYYVPNNMAIILSGDLDFEKTIQLVNQYFGGFETGEIPEFQRPVEDPITEPRIKQVFGPDVEFLRLAYRFDGGFNSRDQLFVTLIDQILSNSRAGLIDLDLVQTQKVLNAGSYSNFLRDYGMHVFYGVPQAEQTLEELKHLLLGEIAKIKNGEFDDWMLEAVINDLRLNQIRQQENNWSKSYGLLNTFIYDSPWEEQVKMLDEMEAISKDDLINFARAHYADSNYVVVYKRTGDDQNIVKMEKPPLNPVKLNREQPSEFFETFTALSSDRLEPVFVNYQESINQSKTQSGLDFYYLKNESNELFTLAYIFGMGKNHNKQLQLAVDYLPFIGTSKYSPAELQQEFFRYGLEMNVRTSSDQSVVIITGLEKSLEKGIELLEHTLNNAKADQQAYENYISGLLKERKDAKLSKNNILWNALFNYGKYGPHSSFTDIISEEELKKIDPVQLTEMIHDLKNYDYQIFYYGTRNQNDLLQYLDTLHHVPEKPWPYPNEEYYSEQETSRNTVYFVNYDMVQTSIVLLSKGPVFNPELIPASRLFGEFYGSGLSSIVFQEIRESKALAYSAFASFAVPVKADRSHYLYAFVGTQADKLKTATYAMINLMNEMPEAGKQFEQAKEAIAKKIETERITKQNVFWNYWSNHKKGIDYDIRQDVYQYVSENSMEDFESFFNEYISNNNYTVLVMGNKELLDMNTLYELGTVKELTLEEVFNY